MARGALAALIALGLAAGCHREHDPGCAPKGAHLVVATSNIDAGALATVDGPSCLGDGWSSTSPDAIVRTVGDRVLAIDRTGGDAIRVYAPGVYDVLEHEFERGGNVHDVLAAGDEWWFSSYERSAITRTDTEGGVLGSIDLAAWADGDGLPEMDRMVQVEDTVYVALQRLDRRDGWAPLPDGTVLGIGSDGAVLSEVAVGPNPKLLADPSDPGALLVLTGRWYEPDGALLRYDPRDESVTELLTEEQLGFDLGGLAGLGDHVVLLGVDFEGISQLVCQNLETGELVYGRSDPAWFVEAITGDDQVYVAVRTGWHDHIARQVWAVDPITCEDTLVADAFTLDPYAMAWVPEQAASSR